MHNASKWAGRSHHDPRGPLAETTDRDHRDVCSISVAGHVMTDLQIDIYGDRWQIKFVPRLPRVDGRKADGLCDRHNREILIRDSLEGAELIETILHELDHAWHWSMDEDNVTAKAQQAASILSQLELIR